MLPEAFLELQRVPQQPVHTECRGCRGLEEPGALPRAVRPNSGVTSSRPERSSLAASWPPAMPAPAQAPNWMLVQGMPYSKLHKLNMSALQSVLSSMPLLGYRVAPTHMLAALLNERAHLLLLVLCQAIQCSVRCRIVDLPGIAQQGSNG